MSNFVMKPSKLQLNNPQKESVYRNNLLIELTNRYGASCLLIYHERSFFQGSDSDIEMICDLVDQDIKTCLHVNNSRWIPKVFIVLVI